MSYVQKDGQGSLFANDYKTTEKHPDLKGTITIDGRQYDLAAWMRKREERTWYSLSVKPKQHKETVKRADDELPEWTP